MADSAGVTMTFARIGLGNMLWLHMQPFVIERWRGRRMWPTGREEQAIHDGSFDTHQRRIEAFRCL